jgi:hypothetical protein
MYNLNVKYIIKPQNYIAYMITCSKCNTSFPIEMQKISKESTLPCVSCGNPCVVKLLDLQNIEVSSHTTNPVSGFGEINLHEINKLQPSEEKETIYVQKQTSDNGFAIKKHFVITTVILKIFLIAFIFGIAQIQFIDSRFPSLARLYNLINVFPRKTVVISNVKVVDDKSNLEFYLNISNHSDKTELVSDVVIVVYDIFHNPISVFEKRPHLLIKPNSDFEMLFNVSNLKEEAKYVSIFMNGKMQVDSNDLKKLLN